MRNDDLHTIELIARLTAEPHVMWPAMLDKLTLDAK